MRPVPAAFTLIELLVVVTIIVMLLALLTPALDKAIAEADLAVCGARLKGLASAAIVYTSGNKRLYPRRKLIETFNGQPSRLSIANPNYDDRAMLKDYVGYDHYLDNFLPAIDIEGSDPDSHLFANYSIWFSYRHSGHNGMRKLGDRVEWKSVTEPSEPLYRFDLLASDSDHIRSGNNWAFTSHPDSEGILAPEAIQDFNTSGVQDQPLVGSKQTKAFWQYAGDARVRGTTDLNYAHENGSVSRMDDVRWNEWQDYDRVVRVPEYSTLANEHPDWHQLPRP